MKKQLFTLLMLVAMVALGSNAMAQTKLTPYKGVLYNYSWIGLDVDTVSDISIAVTSTAPTSPTTLGTAVTQGDGTYTLGTLSYASNKATQPVTWNADASQVYYLSIVVTSSSSCTNMRYVKITIATPVEFELYCLGASSTGDVTSITDYSTTKATPDDDCAPVINPDYDASDGSSTSGYTYVYYRMDRVNGNDSAIDWKFTFAVTTDENNVVADSYEYSSNAGTNWSTAAASLSEVTVPATTATSIYVRVKIDLDANDANNIVTGTESLCQEVYNVSGTTIIYTASDASTDDDVEAVEILDVPSIGAFE